MSTQNKNIVKIAPDAWVASGRKLIVGMERVRQSLAARFARQSEIPQRLFRAALNEAESLAWETDYPQLVFPTLAEEKIAAISYWDDRGGRLQSEYAIAV
ncbi:MAG TPA: hypothetical protein VGV18_03550 [Verrucomicrobiae bacterium]|nr:hypothetical protein [Verrucomicrobiae bacterium]